MNIRPLPEYLQIKAANELNEDPSRIEGDINHFREWIGKQPHLTARQDDQFLMFFLRGCKFSLQKAKEKLDYYYTAKSMLTEFYNCRDPFATDIQAILKTGFILPLTRTVEPSGAKVILLRWCAVDPSTMPYITLIKLLYMILDVLLEEDDTAIISGVHFLPDFKNFPLGYTTQFTPTALHRSSIPGQSAYPLRIKGMDYINVSTFFDTLFHLIKSILSAKLKKRANVYTENNISELYERIPKSILPKEYGGAEETIQELTDKWKAKMESYSKWFKEDEKFGCNEKLRPNGGNNDIFGTDGTFRKLNVD